MRPLPLVLTLALVTPALAWGDRGHEIVNRAAARALPPEVPACLRERVARLTWLGPEPDRWRDRDLPEMNRAYAPDHFVDFEWTDMIDHDRPPPDRYAYAHALREGGRKPEQTGFAPYTVVELCQRIEAALVAIEMLDPAHPEAAERRAQAEEALVYVAGTLGHYVADLANPHHTTIHYNGWVGENPHGFATDKGTHARFESVFVSRVGAQLDALVQVRDRPRVDLDYARAIWSFVRESHGQLEELYRLDRDGAFAEGSDPARGTAFASQRMVRGATLLRDLWATACHRGALRAAATRLRSTILTALEAAEVEVWVDVDLEKRVLLRGRLDDPARHARALAIVRAVPGVTGLVTKVRVLY